MLLSIASLQCMVAFIAEEVSEVESEDTDVGGEKAKEDRDVLCK